MISNNTPETMTRQQKYHEKKNRQKYIGKRNYEEKNEE